MKLAKSLLLGSAAALATVAGAQAADLPVRKAAPVAVEYVRVCSTYGSGFFVIPGTDSCIKLTGRARFEALGTERFNRAQDHFGFRARLRFGADVRTPTEFGLLRTFVRLEATSNSGTPYAGVSANANSTIVQQAYVQFGGLTAGRAVSFFSNADLPTRHFGTLRFDDVPDVTTLAYTYSFGNGFSATLAVEDPWVRRTNNAPFAVGGIANPNVFGAVNGGFEFPDVVGNLKFAGTWGSLQLSGAIHQVTDIGTAAVAAVGPTTITQVINGQVVNVVVNAGTPAVAGRRAADDEIGFAVSGSGHFNLPMIAAGDAVWLWGGYTQGALQYLSGGNAFSAGGSTVGFTSNTLGFAGTGGLPITDGFVRRGSNDLELTEAFSVAGGFRHFFVPARLEWNLFGSYLNVDFGGGASVAAANGVRAGFVDFNEFRIGSNLIWTPIGPGFDIGVEVLYTRIEADSGRFLLTRPGAGAELARTRLDDNEDIFEGRLRVQRDF